MQLCKYLLEECNAMVNIVAESNTALIVACRNGHIELSRYLIEVQGA